MFVMVLFAPFEHACIRTVLYLYVQQVRELNLVSKTKSIFVSEAWCCRTLHLSTLETVTYCQMAPSTSQNAGSNSTLLRT
jgi:hypothetical protein